MLAIWILTLECLQISTKWKLYMFIFAIWRWLIYELFNASLFRNHAGITIQEFLSGFFLTDLPVSNSHPEATLGRAVSPSRLHEQPAMRCSLLGSQKSSPWFFHAILKGSATWFYDERCTPDFGSWSKLPCSFTKSIAKKLSANEMSFSGANLALGNVHWRMCSEEFRHLSISGPCPACAQAPLALVTLQLSQRRWTGSRSSLRRPCVMSPAAERNRGGNQLPRQKAGETSRRGPGTGCWP